ncbi:MAG: PadR family transcriptional regulator [Actinobacteria bacterium]|nr:PadR family transcriptional regulator [Actinomycetota bacterium]
MLELAILGLLEEGDIHGYELRKRLTSMLGAFSSVSFGSLYPALARLESSGAVSVVHDDDAEGASAAPATGSLRGELAAFRARSRRTTGTRGQRGRKVYRITAEGRVRFAEALAAQSPDDDRAFGLALAFARHLPPETRLTLFERRRARLVERLAAARTAMRADRDQLDSYARSLVEHGTKTTEADISWLEGLIAAERNTPATNPTK